MKLLLIDGNSILNRAYFALPPLNDKSGRNVNAVYGFVNILLKVLADQKPDKLIVAFDKHGHNFRKDIYAEYKATRKGMPDDLAAQMPILHDLLYAMQVSVVEKPGIEADDIIGTISKANHGKGSTLIVSGDRDMLQLVKDDVTVLLTKRGVTEVESVTPQTLAEVYHMTAEQVIEYKALRGDTSDNIPGVKGVGEVTAMSLLAKYGNIDNLYEHIDQEKGALKEKLVRDKELAFISRKLATIVTNADIDFDIDSSNLPVADSNVMNVMESLSFKSLIPRLNFTEEVKQQKVDVQVENVVIEDLLSLQKVADELNKSEYFAFYTDGNTVLLSSSKTKQYSVLLSDSFLDELNTQNVYSTLLPVLISNTPKAVYDGKTLRHFLQNNVGADLTNVKYDVCLMQYLVEYRAYKDVESLCQAYGYNQFGAGIYALAQLLNDQLKNLGLTSLYYDVELPLSDLLFRMENEGLKVDIDLLNAMSNDMREQTQALTKEIWNLAGEEFNINSPMQLAKILFENLGLPHGKKTHSGYYTTDSDTLEYIKDKHPIVEKVLEYRKIAKLSGTYVDGLKPLLRGGLVHTTFNQSLTSTGRLSSSDPNLQNIPIRDELGKEIRRLFVSKYGTFVGADYSQIELRLLAAFSEDENLLNSFKRGEDIHTKVASELLAIPQEMINHEMRRMAKAVNFGIIYGISNFGLSQNTNISMQKAKEYIELYFSRFPKIKSYLDGNVVFAKKNGYVCTLSGRRRQIPEVNSSNANLRNFGERAAMNMPLQGSAADIMKIAMLKVDEAIRSAGLKSKIVLQIHDELIVDCYLDEAEQVKKIVKEQMEQAVNLACPLIAETEEGVTLYDA